MMMEKKSEKAEKKLERERKQELKRLQQEQKREADKAIKTFVEGFTINAGKSSGSNGAEASLSQQSC